MGDEIELRIESNSAAGDFAGVRFQIDATADNYPPEANAGDNQAIHVGEPVQLDGSNSLDDMTPTENLIFAWSFEVSPDGSSALLNGTDTPEPSFVPDVLGDYVIRLVVIDEQGLISAPDLVTVSSENVAPNADAGADQGALVDHIVHLDGSASNDPDGDALTFSWSMSDRPGGSTATIDDPFVGMPSLSPDVPGVYVAQLVVNDGLADSVPDDVVVTAVLPEQFVETTTMTVLNVVVSFESSEVSTTGNQQALANMLSRVIAEVQSGDRQRARNKLEMAIERTDGCAVRGTPDLMGGGNTPAKDYIVTCDGQALVYTSLLEALDALN